MSLPLTDKIAIVTGSSRGIGAAVVKRLAADGATVVINYNSSQSAADELARTINDAGRGHAIAVQSDMSSVKDALSLVDQTIERFGRLDVLVLNAGLMQGATHDEISETHFDEHFNVNVKVPLFMVQSASKHLAAGGRVIFFSSSATRFSGAPPLYTVYTATKGAVEQLTRVLSKDLGARGITVNAIAPGPVDTDMFRNGMPPELVALFESLHPQKRIPLPDEISPIVAFLARDEAGWVNGQTIFVSGGMAV